MSPLSPLALAATAFVVALTVQNECGESVLVVTDTYNGHIDNYVTIGAGASANMSISSDWYGAIKIGTGCNSDGSSCTTGGPRWNGETPFSRARFNYFYFSHVVIYDLSLVFGYNVGMEISAADANCATFACTLPDGCPVPGPVNGTCYSGCCSSAEACSGGAFPAGGGGCVNNRGPGPYSSFYYDNCPNAYAFPDDDGNEGYPPTGYVEEYCGNTDITLTLCPGFTSSK